MSQACISYSSLTNASSEASEVAKKLEKYASNLETQVYRKLSDYNGTYSSNISQAKRCVNEKISALKLTETAYKTYANDLNDLRKQCINTDKAVKLNVSKLTSDFKVANGIKDSAIVYGINYLFTSIGNASAMGRWIGNNSDKGSSVKEYIKQSIEDWWDYEGGKQLTKGISIAILEGVLAVCGFIAALAGGGVIVLIAGVITAIIAGVNACVNFSNELSAYKTTKNGEPATGRRRSEVDTLQDYLRSSFVYGDSGEKYKYDANLYAIATGIDAVSFVCGVITFFDGLGEFVKNAYKWTTGSMANIKNLKIKDILTKENFGGFVSKIGDTMKTGWSDITSAIKSGNFTRIKEFTFDFADDFMNNLKKGYTFEIFAEDKKAVDFIKHGASLTKNYASITKTFIKDGINFETVGWKVGLKKLILPNINIAEISTYKGGSGGVFSYDIGAIKLTNITGIYTDTKDIFKDGSSIFEKLDLGSDIDIKVPEIIMPNLTGINSTKFQMVY